jgi:hypothetical protein
VTAWLYATGNYSDAAIACELNQRGYRMVSKRHPEGYPFTKAAHRRSIPTAQVDAALAAYISAIKLPDDWQAEVLQVATGSDAAARIDDKRTALLRRLERLQELKYDPDTDLADWRARKAKLEAELATLEQEGVPGARVVERAAAFLQVLSSVWAAATEEERRHLVAAMVEAVWCNLDKKRVEAIQFKDFLYPVRGVLAWILTLPASFLLGWLLMMLATAVFGL